MSQQVIKNTQNTLIIITLINIIIIIIITHIVPYYPYCWCTQLLLVYTAIFPGPTVRTVGADSKCSLGHPLHVDTSQYD